MSKSGKVRFHVERKLLLLFFLLLAALAIFFMIRQNKEGKSSGEHRHAFEVALRWNTCLLDMDRFSEGYRPPVSARMFAYAGMAAWESALPGLPEAISCAAAFPGPDLPAWQAAGEFVPAAALDAAYSTIARHFFPHMTLPMKEKCARLSAEVYGELISAYPPEAIAASKQFGQAVAAAVFRWSATDPVGHQAFLFNYDRTYEIAEGPGQWRPSGTDLMPPLLPQWGNARTFSTHADILDIRPPVDFSEMPNSAFFAQALEVYNLSQSPKEEYRWIAEFWSDDFSGVTFSAASRWISIANQAMEKEYPGLATALETWFKTGLAINDVAVLTWRAKYAINLERPDTYIRRNIHPGWEPLHHAPPFPGYPSGHSSFAGAATAVLTRMLGENFSMTDRSHQGRKEFSSKPRSYRSFAEMAEECALSRILLGVHFRMDCEEGLQLGYAVGEKIASISLRRKAAQTQKNRLTTEFRSSQR